MVVSMSRKPLGSVIAGAFVFMFALLMPNSAVLATSTVKLGITASSATGNDSYDVVVKDSPGTRLALYVNDENPIKATVNRQNRATFHRVVLVDTGKISFTQILRHKNRRAYEKQLKYVRFFSVTNGRVTFAKNEPKPDEPAAPAPAPADPQPAAPTPPSPAPEPITTLSCTNGTYVNVAGNTVCSPEQSPTAPPGATAQCRDGTYSFSQTRSGTCSHHGGVATWL